ncbi:MAG TPA: dephospho-CoA kinase [Balneolales bacterium]|nr:dephospho-CoA kinase [Balneolales bacterium]
MIKAGITGGIGSGKTTICRIWESLGAKVVYADELAKELMTHDVKLRDAIKSVFGDDAYDKKGQLNREYLAWEAFHKGRVEELNRLVHPRVKDEVKRMATEAEDEGFRMFVEEAALLLNEGRPEHLDVIILVEAPEEERIVRVSIRDETDSERVKARMERQADPKQLRIYADYIIVNDASMEELIDRSRSLYQTLLHTEVAK